MKSAKLWLFLGMLVCSFPILAQSNPNEEQGLKPYDSFHGGDLDSVSLTNGGLSLHIPLASFPQRGNLDLSFMITASNKQWYVKPAKYDKNGNVSTPAQWQPMPNTGVQIVSSTDWWISGSWATEPPDPNMPAQVLYDWSQSVSSPDGSTHLFGDQIAAFGGPTYPMRSLDASGLVRPDAQTLILPNGTRYSYPTLTDTSNTSPFGHVRGGKQASSVTDANGNQITIGTSGWTDTMGRFIPGSAGTAVQGIQPGVSTSDLSKCPAGTASALIWNVPGVSTLNGGVRTFYFCYAMFTLSTNFPNASSTTGLNFGPTSRSLLSAVVLPDLTMWTFTYDNYGDVLHVGFPTGGSLSYTYGTGPASASTGTGFSTWVFTRTVDANDGTGGHQWTYNYQGGFPSGSGTSIFMYGTKGVATVTSPDGNDVVHNIGPSTNASGCPGYEYQTQYFQGSAASGRLLKTVQTQYDCTMGTPGGDLDSDSLNAVPTQVTTILPGGQTARAVSSYDATFNDPNGQAVRIGSLLQRDEYDFSNTLVRSTLNHYLWQDNATYKAANFIQSPVSTTFKDGAGAQVAQKTFGYDQGTLGSSGIGAPTHVAPPAGEPYRGNLTTVGGWLDTTNAIISSTFTYLDTGMKASSTDPLGHVTTYTYGSAFQGAYLTQTNLPDTQMPDSGAPMVHHVVSGNYDFNTGVLTSFTDENSQQYSYSYDIMLRVTQGNHPDGGITKFLYPDPNTVERQRLITGTTYDDYKVKFDGLGRPYQTQQLTPDCASYIKVDTIYDVAGRAKTVSNPYCLTTEPTYGITQSDYDALSRTTKTTKQDGSITTVKYEDTPGDISGAPLVCTTATDGSGKKRQACSDALGRLAKVVEPNPGAAATYATGWAAVSGTGQSATSQPAASGHVTITISGSEQSTVVDPCTDLGQPRPCPQTRWDTGAVYLTVNGHTNSGSYGHFDTSSSVASNLAANINADSAAFVTATVSGSSVTVTAKTTGAATNYSFSSSSATGDPTDFGVPSFSASPTSGTLTGGQNASTIADSGSVTVTVNGTSYSTTFGSGDTSSTIASRLATAITSGAYANASASGSTINLTSKTPGTAGDYSLSAPYTWNSAQFTNPSFTTSTSGSALSGAKDASALNNNPFVTTYQYNARGDLICVHQKATDTTADVACTGTTPPVVPATWRQRYFTYDSFSRLLTAMNPELNSTGNTKITYTYDNGSRLTSKLEPAPNQAWGSAATVTVNYTYDALNRLLDTTYSDGTTQGTSHRYDYSSFLGQTFSNPIGREVAATAASNTIEFFTSYDPMGRIISTAQCNPGVTGCKTFTAGYDKLGDLTSLSYPGNSFIVTYGYDSAARLTTATDSNGVIYAQTPAYIAGSILNEFTSPNFANNKYHVTYNNRLQPIEIWAGSAQGAPALFDKQYSYGPVGANNGNIFSVINVKDSTRTQSFSYDPLNRLLTAGDSGHWANTYTYDAWGNLTNKTPGAPAGENLNTSADTNNHLTGLTYDAAGNVTNDGLGGVFVFDVENRIKVAGSVTYTYDTYGRRIQKSTGINYWYGPGGQALGETDSAGKWTNYIFFGGQRLARNIPQPSPNPADIKYYITDHLHSTAMFVDKAGTAAAILDDNDMYPWGGVVPGVGKTTSTNTIKFTGQYRDTDTAATLDYFGARYYSNTTGRFMSPDWAAGPITVPYAKFGDPQSLNLYSYVENRPTALFDPDGHDGDDKTNVKEDTVNTNKDGSTTTVHVDPTSQPTSYQVSLGNGNWMTVTETTTQTTTTERDSNGKVTSEKIDVTKDVTVTNTDRNGNTKTLYKATNVPVSSKTLTEKDLKGNPQTFSARLKDRPIGPDLGLIPKAGEYLKAFCELFGLTYGDLQNFNTPMSEIPPSQYGLGTVGP